MSWRVNECVAYTHKQLPMSYWKLNFTKIQQIASLHIIIIIIVVTVVLCECELPTLFRWVLKYEHEYRCKSGCDCSFLFLIFCFIRSYKCLQPAKHLHSHSHAHQIFLVRHLSSCFFAMFGFVPFWFSTQWHHRISSLQYHWKWLYVLYICACAHMYIHREKLYHVYCVCMWIYTQSDRNFCWITVFTKLYMHDLELGVCVRARARIRLCLHCFSSLILTWILANQQR